MKQAMNEAKTPKQLERYFKGVANHRRLEIMMLVARTGNMSLDEIVQALRANTKTISEHTKKLVQAGLLNKKYRGRAVEHTLSPYGKKFISFTKSF